MFAVAMFVGVGCGCVALPAGAQSCAEQLRKGAGRHAKAMISVEELRIPGKAWEHLDRARTASLTGRMVEFERESGMALAIAPDLAEVYLLRAAVENRAQRFEAALVAIRAGRAIRPRLAWSAEVAAASLNGLKRYAEARAELDGAGAFEAEGWQWRLERTRAEVGLGHVAEALQWSERAAEAMPAGCTEGRLLRSNALQLAGQWAGAIAELEAYLAGGGQLAYREQAERVLGKLKAQEQARARERPGGEDAYGVAELGTK